jgi:DNA-binding response OmpR family regulator
LPEVLSVVINRTYAKVLAIEGRARERNSLSTALERFSFEVRTVWDGRAAADALAVWQADAIVLEHDVRGIECLSLISSLRRITDAPIVVVAARSEVGHTVSALIRGADDHVVGPLAIEELAARIHALLRRPRMTAPMVVRYTDLSIDVTSRRAVRAGTLLQLSLREFDLLLTLARNSEKVLSKSSLLDLVWGIDSDVSPATVETYISYLRSKLEVPGTLPLIQTVRGVGYTMRVERESVKTAA